MLDMARVSVKLLLAVEVFPIFPHPFQNSDLGGPLS